MDIFSLGGVILDLLQTVVDFWNDKVSLVFELLGQSPVSFKNGGPWAVVANLEPIFVAVGSSLVVLFFVIGFCSESRNQLQRTEPPVMNQPPQIWVQGLPPLPRGLRS